MKLRQLYARFRSLRRWNRKEAELDDEIRFHLSEEADERAAAGLTEEEARFAARRDFGNAALVREETRETWGWGAAERLVQDARSAFRMMARDRGFSAIAVSTLALGIGATTAILTVVNGVLVQTAALPGREPARRPVRHHSQAGRRSRHHVLPRHHGLERSEPRVCRRRGVPAGVVQHHRRRPTGAGQGSTGLSRTVDRARREPGHRPDLRQRRATGRRRRRAHQPRALDAALRERPWPPQQNDPRERREPRRHRRASGRLRVPPVPGHRCDRAGARADLPFVRIRPRGGAVANGRAGRRRTTGARRDRGGSGQSIPGLERRPGRERGAPPGRGGGTGADTYPRYFWEPVRSCC